MIAMNRKIDIDIITRVLFKHTLLIWLYVLHNLAKQEIALISHYYYKHSSNSYLRIYYST
jgi:predicted metallo-beta-lactamase superfamily hydrolase